MARAETGDTEASGARFDATTFERLLEHQAPVRWIGWRLRLLVAAALVGCVGIFLLVRHIGASPVIDAGWRTGLAGQMVLASSGDPTLQPHVGRTLVSITAAGATSHRIEETWLRAAPRWTVDEVRRDRIVETHEWFERALGRGPVVLHFADGESARVAARPRGLSGIGLVFWPLALLSLIVVLIGASAWLVRPQWRNALYVLIAACQSINLLFIAVESVRFVPLPEPFVGLDLAWRMGLDLVTAAAILHTMTLHPSPVPHGRWIAAAGWAAVALALWAGPGLEVAHWWWWTQAGVVALGAAALAVLSWSNRLQPNPYKVIMRRFGFVALASLATLTVALGAASSEPGVQHRVAEVGSVIWYVFFTSLVVLVPFLSRSRQLLREFALLAGISTVATSLDLVFVALFSLGPFASLTLSVFLALGVYAGARQWILNQLTGSNALTLERSFETLYRAAREVEAHPERHGALLLRVLRELFEPLEVLDIEKPLAAARIVANGSALLVPAPRRGDTATGELPPPRVWALRFARRGKGIFADADARLADRIAEQLRRAVAYDKAVERGRSEERLRIAQDLHDDIGARLLTLMYQAQTPEMEDYIRHTLQDLKTLTRGLAARQHHLSHAAAEWKADIAQRLAAARIELGWSFDCDREVALTVVQWSALTRVLRELVTNAIYHARATRVEIAAQLASGRLTMTVADDGQGRRPEAWAHGLGLGGVRKRVKQLGGEVRWRENTPRGIVCEVTIPGLDKDAAGPTAPSP
jgi:signal transduction histidine kinase